MKRLLECGFRPNGLLVGLACGRDMVEAVGSVSGSAAEVECDAG